MVKVLISLSSNKMANILDKFGVPADEKSPFCRSFETPQDLMNTLIDFLPSTFSYPAQSGESNEPSATKDDDKEVT